MMLLHLRSGYSSSWNRCEIAVLFTSGHWWLWSPWLICPSKNSKPRRPGMPEMHRAVAQWDALQTANYEFGPGSQHDPNEVNLSCHKQSGNEGKDGENPQNKEKVSEISVIFKQISTSTCWKDTSLQIRICIFSVTTSVQSSQHPWATKLKWKPGTFWCELERNQFGLELCWDTWWLFIVAHKEEPPGIPSNRAPVQKVCKWTHRTLTAQDWWIHCCTSPRVELWKNQARNSESPFQLRWWPAHGAHANDRWNSRCEAWISTCYMCLSRIIPNVSWVQCSKEHYRQMRDRPGFERRSSLNAAKTL